MHGPMSKADKSPAFGLGFKSMSSSSSDDATDPASSSSSSELPLSASSSTTDKNEIRSKLKNKERTNKQKQGAPILKQDGAASPVLPVVRATTCPELKDDPEVKQEPMVVEEPLANEQSRK